MLNFKLGDRVFVSNWGQNYSDFFTWKDGKRTSIWKWKTEIPDYTSTGFHVKTKTRPVLTAKGVPYKNGKSEVVSRINTYKNYEYEILECVKNDEGELIYLLSSTHTNVNSLKCYVQIGEFGLTKLSVEEQEKIKNTRKRDITTGFS